MPVSICPHCQTQLWVKNNQMNVANGFVKCRQCGGLLQAKHYLDKERTRQTPEMYEAISDVALVSKIGLQIRQYTALSKDEIGNLLIKGIPPANEHHKAPQKTGQKVLSKTEIADLLDNLHASVRKKPHLTSKDEAHSDDKALANKNETNWVLAVMVALTVLILQLFYLFLMG